MATIVKEGYLTKEGGAVKTWKKRYFHLMSNGMLQYYKAKGDKLMGEIDIAHAEGIDLDVDHKKKKNVFAVRTPGRTYHVSGNTAEEMKAWVQDINKVRTSAPGGGAATTAAAAPSGGAAAAAPAGAGEASADGSSAASPAADGKKLTAEDFEIKKVIGKGSFGKVLLVTRKGEPDKVYAMKVLNKKAIIERNELEHTKSEKSILMKLDNPFLVKLHFAFQTPEKLYFVMDFVNGGELFFHLQKSKKFDEERVRFYAAEIVLGLSYLHNEGVIYRDLKPENLLLTAEGHICMTDFGISKEGLVAKDDRTATFCGTPEYLAPEVLRGKGYGKGVDWWSFGTLMYEMLTGLPPFYCEDVQVMYQKIMNAPLQLPSDLSEDTRDILAGLLDRDPEKRLSDPESIQSHPYFKTIDWKKLYGKQIPPPYVPPVRSMDDTNQIDPTFTEENPMSLQEDSSISNAQQENFVGFTYVGESAINK